MSDPTVESPDELSARLDQVAARVQEAMKAASDAVLVVRDALEELVGIARSLKQQRANPPA